ncbi:trichohyalin, putative [Entamoeba histolytica]
MENQEKRRTVQQSVSELVHLEKLRTEIEKKLQNQELRISNLETNIELMLTKNTIMQEISNTVNESEEEISEQLGRIKEENERTRKELEGHEIQIESNTLNIEVQRYLIEKMKKKMNGCTINDEVIKELIKEEITKKYLQKIKDEIEKNKKEENYRTDNNSPIKEQPENNPINKPNNTVAKQPHNNKSTSVFDQKIINKEHIIIIIEDEEGNKFGGYVNSKIDKVGNGFIGDYIYDSKSFVFSLESNGRIEGMMKFDIKLQQYAFILYNQSHDCFQNCFEYNGIENALCGKEIPECFTSKRIIVIEMIQS